MALVVSLALIVLVTFAVLAFFGYATANRRVEASRSHRIQAELLGESAVAHVEGAMLEEVRARSAKSTQAGVTIYTPLSAADSQPQRKLAAGITAGDERFHNLLRQSVSGADPLASGHSSSDEARNGRKLNTRRWDAPALVVGDSSGAGFTDRNQLPHWIYVDRRAGLSSQPTADTIGRFAYNLYDIGGLLNANVAGFPSGLTAAGKDRLSAGQDGADLSRLLTRAKSGLAPAAAEAAVDRLVSFRHPGFPDSLSADQVAERTSGAAKGGFLSSRADNPASSGPFDWNLFNTRQDLIHYARTQNTELAAALPYLTHVSRALNAPTWIPPVSNPSKSFTYGNASVPSVRFAASGTVSYFGDDGKTEARNVEAGEPLLQRRFSLGKLAWLTPEGPSALLPKEHLRYHAGGTEAAIQACFGLRWNDSAERWNYVGPSGTVTQSFIKTLPEIASEPSPRMPNFFELLKAGLLDGSLGASAGNKGFPSGSGNTGTRSIVTEFPDPDDPYPYDRNEDLHVLKIGMNIVDCGDPDNFPAVAALEFGGEAVERCGIEDLPYLYAMNMMNLRRLDYQKDGVVALDDPATDHNESRTVTDGIETYYVWDAKNQKNIRREGYHYLWSGIYWVPELFSPHQQAASSGETPKKIRIGIAPGSALTKVGFFENAFNSPLPITATQQDLGNRAPIEVEADDYEKYRAAPSAVVDSSGPSRLGLLRPELLTPIPAMSTPMPGPKDQQAFAIYDFEGGQEFIVDSAAVKMPGVEVANLIVRAQYQTPKGNWKTYSSFGGEESNSQYAGINGAYDDASISGVRIPIFKQSDGLQEFKSIPAPSNLDRMLGTYLMNWDPVVSRFGGIYGKYQRTVGARPNFTRLYEVQKIGATKFNDNHGPSVQPFEPNRYFMHSMQWPPTEPPALRTGVVGNFPQFPGFDDQDKDSALGPRPPDAHVGYTLPQASTLSNPYGNLADFSRRRVVLQRPFRSAAELGYVSRDIPWQSLNFFNGRSADSGLLDLFSARDEGEVTAGRLSLPGMPRAVLEAVLAGAAQNPDGTLPVGDGQAATAADAIKAFDFQNGSYLYASGSAAPQNVAHLPDALSGLSETQLSPFKYRREAVMRVLADSQTRTWNMLVDVVAQVGKFPPGADPEARNFMVEGESRTWTSLAVDRYTGEILESLVEKVYE